MNTFRLLAILCFAAPILTEGIIGAPAVAAPRPNFIILLADDMAQQDIGFFGQKEYATPNLDRLAREGKVFSNAYAGAPVCAPSRATLLTGLHTGHARVRSLGTRLKGQNAILLQQDVTIAEVLKGAGYRTGIVGKWGLGAIGEEGHPLDQGFDFFYGFETHEQAHNFFPPFLTRKRSREPIAGNVGFDMQRIYRFDRDRSQPQVAKGFWPKYGPDGALDLADLGVKTPSAARYSQDLVQTAALEFLNQKDDRPFFLYYATQIPHGPVIIPNLGAFRDKPWGLKHKTWAAMITCLDDDVGELVATLEKNGQRKNTIIVFASDNGCEPGYLATRLDAWMRGDDPVFHNFGPGRGMKYTHYERGMRVSSFFNGPGIIAAGKSSQLTTNYDLLPTLASLAGIKLSNATDGIDLSAALKGTAPDARRFLYWEDGATPGLQAVRFGDWFAVRPHPEKPMELYDLAADIECRNNLAPSRPKIVAGIARIMKDQHTASAWYPSPLDP